MLLHGVGGEQGRARERGRVFRALDLPTPDAEPHGIAVAGDGAVWVALEAGSVVRLSAGLVRRSS